MRKLDEYLRIKDAAGYLGVSPNTLRNWGRSGKIPERRHPANGYRLYAKEELDALLSEAESPVNMKPTKRKPASPHFPARRPTRKATSSP